MAFQVGFRGLPLAVCKWRLGQEPAGFGIVLDACQEEHLFLEFTLRGSDALEIDLQLGKSIMQARCLALSSRGVLQT
ncbi:MAG: hypothetical protein ACI867_001470 [Glaciecola sp.]